VQRFSNKNGGLRLSDTVCTAPLGPKIQKPFVSIEHIDPYTIGCPILLKILQTFQSKKYVIPIY
jgi:hypothetical protein